YYTLNNGTSERQTRNDLPVTYFMAGVPLTIMTAFGCSNAMKNGIISFVIGIPYMHGATTTRN
ncbi:hypothetical protein L873DRAFT_1818756, partial [Choiromyces venosus 120613-1]